MSKEIIKGNKLIAEFMIPYFATDIDNYHSDWNSLMPVVEKIENTKIKHKHNTDARKKTQFKVIIHRFCCDIQNDNDFFGDHIIEITGQKDKITAAWKAVIQFIQWYSQQNNKP